MYRKDSGYEYSASRIYLAQEDQGKVTYIKGTKGGWNRDLYLECEGL